ncbi:MAG: hypothetical protein M1827_000444 [Pycnora praestabilis]|nr:MAG: hypothetical protein M1827_000444 [Pycnora praestabilis]
MTEDDVYRASTQYRLWSFTSDSLASLRKTTNSNTAGRVRVAIKRARESQTSTPIPSSGNTSDNGVPGRSVSGDGKESDIECLTVEEEQKLVGFYCAQAIKLAKFCDFPTNVTATAVQYLRRFYLSNSPMTYHPKSIMLSTVFLSTKTEHHYSSLKSFASKCNQLPEDVIAPEFLVTQGLRFTFDVRHPGRGLEGGFMELIAMVDGTGQSLLGDTRSSKQLQEAIINVEGLGGVGVTKTVENTRERIQRAHGKAKEKLKNEALLTDAYFLYTPSQIWLAALFLIDEPLFFFYISTKFPPSSTPSSLKPKVITTIRTCASLLSSCTVSVESSKEEKKELTRIDKKLYHCRNPEKMDLVGLNKAQKREGDVAEGEVDEKAAKKRKLERETRQKEVDDVFGPALSK